MKEMIDRMSVIQEVNDLRHEMGLVSVDAVKKAVLSIPAAPLPAPTVCVGLTEFKKEDALPGMVFVLRSGSEVNMGFLNWHKYSDDMRLVGDFPDGMTRENADVVQVRLPSGAVIWERSTEAPVAAVCSNCDRLGKGDPVCGCCMRGGHGNTVDFYRPKGRP